MGTKVGNGKALNGSIGSKFLGLHATITLTIFKKQKWLMRPKKFNPVKPNSPSSKNRGREKYLCLAWIPIRPMKSYRREIRSKVLEGRKKEAMPAGNINKTKELTSQWHLIQCLVTRKQRKNRPSNLIGSTYMRNSMSSVRGWWYCQSLLETFS